MIVRARTPIVDSLGCIKLVDIGIDQLTITEPSVLSIDASTDNTGMSILRESDGAIVATLSFKHETNKETPVHYKVKLKKEVYKILSKNKMIREIFYEEPFIGYAGASKNLLMLRTFVEELIYENEPDLNYIGYTEINNMKWKKLFLMPDKCPSGTEAQKKAVRDKLVSALTYLNDITQDEIDSICMGFIATVKLRQGLKEDLKSQKKAKPFKYDIQFIGADSDDVMVQELYDVCEAPKAVTSNGIALITLNGKANMEKAIYEHMGSEDKLLIMKFDSTKYGNIILKYKLGHLTQFGYIYALVWRHNRK